MFNQLDASITKAESLVREASDHGASFVIFGETWFAGYPAWLDHCPGMGKWNHPPTKAVFAEMINNSLEVPGSGVDRLERMAKENGVAICAGINEKVSSGPGNGTIFNSLIMINEKGELIFHHRKLMPTYTEKLIYGLGDGRGTHPIQLQGYQVGGLICWEHWMPLTRYTLHEAGEHIHIAVWPTVHEMHQIASRHYAFEGRCFVITAGQMMRVSDLPKQLTIPEKWKNTPNEWVLRGGSAVIGPDGNYIVEPIYEQELIIYAEIHPDEVYEERMTLDVSGHYQRSDLFNFSFHPLRE